MRKWEFLMFHFNAEYAERSWLNPAQYFNASNYPHKYKYPSVEEAGLDGWELVTTQETTDGDILSWVFKREIFPKEG